VAEKTMEAKKIKEAEQEAEIKKNFVKKNKKRSVKKE
jgi:hypothetical protein